MKKTLLVLGAGASKDILDFFPTGFELIKDINYHLTTEEKFNFNPFTEGHYLSALTNAIECAFGQDKYKFVNEFKTKLWQVVLDYEWNYPRGIETEPPLIDAFISSEIKNKGLRKETKDIAQFAIAYLIIGSEEALKGHKLKKPTDNNWIHNLFKKLSKYSFQEVLENFSVLTFNYDRVFEYYSSQLIDIYFNNVTKEQKNKFISKIFHIYGSLGKLHKVDFGNRNDEAQKMLKVCKNFKLIYDERVPKTYSVDGNLKQIFFLGFGYDKTNLSNLDLTRHGKSLKSGTGYKLKNEHKEELQRDYGISVRNYTCNEFIKKAVAF
jgi:hypothetical protein